MDPFSTEELHHIPFEINKLEVESNLLSASPNGLVFVARRNDLAIFTASDYHQASSSFSQRKDKPLTTFQPNLCINLPHRVTWLSVNCSGSLLLIAYGSSIQLLNVQQVSDHFPHGLLGNASDIPNEEGTIRKMAWNPADKHRFALVTTTGSVRIPYINCPPYTSSVARGHQNLVNISGIEDLGIAVLYRSQFISWSPKGKQLALAGIGAPSESAANPAATKSTSIVQVDHDLKVKRIIPIDALLKQHLKDFTEPQPIDILWTSSYCFLLGVVDATKAKEMRLVFITVLPKSEPRLGKLPEFTSIGSGLCRYLMCLVPNSITLAAVTWSPDAEECYLLDIPTISALPKSPSADSLPKLIKSLPLPTDSYPIAMHVGALVDSPDPLPLIIGLLANGALFAFKLLPPKGTPAGGSCNIFAGFHMWCGSADKPPQLPSDGPAANMTVTTLATSEVKPTNADENPTAGPSSLTQSIMEAANHFWKALKSQAETSARAWSRLQSVFEGNSLNLQHKGDGEGVRRGVWDIEQSLSNMDDFLCVVEEITAELRKASQLSVNEQAASADFLDRLSADFEAFQHRINDKHRVIVAAGLDPRAAATLASLRRKSRAAESFLAELEDQVESLSAHLEARNECSNRLMGRSGSKSSLPVGDVGSPLDKIQATIATNARLIKCERYRLELISRMAGLSLSDCSANNLKNTSTSAPSLGGSAVCVDREQRDARLYRQLCARDKCKTKTRAEKSAGLERLPIAKAPSTVAEVLELMRKEKEKEAQPLKLTSKSAGRIPLKAAGASSSPKAASQMNLPGQEKNLEISKLLASAASVPPVTLASGYPDSGASGFTFAIATEDVPTSTPVHKATEKSQPQKVAPIIKSEAPFVTPSSIGDAVSVTSPPKPPSTGVASLSKPSIFVPSTSKSLTLPTRVTPIAAPTTKVLGAPMGDSGVENFKPLSPRHQIKPDGFMCIFSCIFSSISNECSRRGFNWRIFCFSITKTSRFYIKFRSNRCSNPPGPISVPITTTPEPTNAFLENFSLFGNFLSFAAVVTSTVSKPFAGGLFGPIPLPTSAIDLSSNEKSAASASATFTAATAATPKSNLFGSPPVTLATTSITTTTPTPMVTSVSMSSEPSRCLFGKPTIS
ncbi:unnamed protein product [Taenia asiatica]|uniref:Nuclear pore complex protein Nup214 n=1 Tax=Taenia asiatica TaxID=60517 RepID=A0A158R6R6_TAEAS|nr:unnamed protein product [Taenia asiatica]